MKKKHGLESFVKWAVFAGVLLFCTASLPAHAKDGRQKDDPTQDRVTPTSAGGTWREYDSRDPMTDVKRARFELEGNDPLRDSSRNPRINIYCENGKYLYGHFDPYVRVDPNRPGFWGQPQVEVLVRVDSHTDRHGCNWNGHFLSMDKGTVRGLIGATVFKVQLPGPGTPDNIATFSPAGLNLTQFENACHLKPSR